MPHLESSGPQAGEGRWLWQRSPHSSKAADGESWARLSQQEESSQGLPRACQGLITCCRGSGVGLPSPAVGGVEWESQHLLSGDSAPWHLVKEGALPVQVGRKGFLYAGKSSRKSSA